MPSKALNLPFLILKVRYPAIKVGFFYCGVVLVQGSTSILDIKYTISPIVH